ncbi:MAG: IS256 family transposase, partial [Propionicimonas sp.]
YKLIEAAQAHWQPVNAPSLVALVRAGARFKNGKLVEMPPSTPESTPDIRHLTAA